MGSNSIGLMDPERSWPIVRTPPLDAAPACPPKVAACAPRRSPVASTHIVTQRAARTVVVLIVLAILLVRCRASLTRACHWSKPGGHVVAVTSNRPGGVRGALVTETALLYRSFGPDASTTPQHPPNLPPVFEASTTRPTRRAPP